MTNGEAYDLGMLVAPGELDHVGDIGSGVSQHTWFSRSGALRQPAKRTSADHAHGAPILVAR